MSLIEIENKIKAQYNVVKSERDISLCLIDKIFCNLDNKVKKMLNFMKRNNDFNAGLTESSRHFKDIRKVEDMWIQINGTLREVYKILGPDAVLENKMPPRSDNRVRKVDIMSKSISQKLDQTISVPKPDPSIFKTSEWYSGNVNHIIDRKNGKFFMILYNPQFLFLMNELKKLTKSYSRDPAIGEMFAIVNPDNLNCRAIRLPFSHSDNNNKILKILLIDTGEEVLCDPGECQFLSIPNELKKIPSMAIRCKAEIDDIDEIIDMNLEFQVIKVETANKKKGHLYDLYHVKFRYSDEKTNSEISEDTSNRSFTSGSFNEMVFDAKPAEFKICRENMTEEELEMLNEEPKAMTDQLVAVMGYHPREDEELCRFTDPKTGCCFKKGHCGLKHMPRLKDGWTRDKGELNISIPLELDLPRENTDFHLKITSIDSVDSFYGHIVDTECPNPNFQLNLAQMVREMNEPGVVEDYKMFDMNPAIMELVVAKYVDDKFYRAQLLEIQNDLFKVFYVDYGDVGIVSLKKLRKFHPKFGLLPFQAVKFHLSNVQALKLGDKTHASVLSEMCRNKTLTARMIHADCAGHLFIRLYNEYGDDIGESLMRLGIVERRRKEYWVKPNPTKKLPA